MSLFVLLITIALVGLVVWAIGELVPMPPQFKKAIYVLAIVFLVLYVLNVLGALPGNLNPRIN